MKLKRPAPEERFLFETKGEAPKNIETPASPLSKKVQLSLTCMILAKSAKEETMQN